MQRILLGYDGSEHAHVAARWAGCLGARSGATVTVLYAASESGFHSLLAPASADGYEAIAADGACIVAAAGASVRAETALSKPAAALAYASRGHDLVVVGHRTEGGLARLILGSTTKALLNEAACPVLATRGAGPPGGDRLDHVLVASDGSADADAALDAALVLARSCAARLTVLHVGEAPGAAAGGAPAAALMATPGMPVSSEAVLLGAVVACRRAGVSAAGVHAEGDPPDTILEHAAARRVGIIALGRSGWDGTADGELGRVCAAVLRRATGPVLVAGRPLAGG